MPKTRRSRIALLKSWIKDDSNFVINESNERSVYCEPCNKSIKCERKSQLVQHVNTASHKRHLKEATNTGGNDTSQQPPTSSKKNEFYADLIQAMVAINMPWCALNNDVWRNFLTKYTDRTIPDESTLRKNYLDDCYDSSIQNIREDIANHCMWISVDETTNAVGHYIANVVVGKLWEGQITKPHLLCSKQLEATNYATISRFVNSVLRILLPNGGEERILLLVTDAAPYMIKAGKKLKLFYENLVHITCIVHGLHRIAEEVHLHFPLVNKLVSRIKKIFVKAPLRIETYHKILKNSPLPLEPILTRWGTWIEAALFYAEHFDKIKEVVQTFKETDAAAIKTAQDVIQQDELVQNLIFIKAHLSTLPATIEKLETVGLPLNTSMEIYMNYINHLKGIPGECGEKIRKKVTAVVEKNTGLTKLIQISNSLNSEFVQDPIDSPEIYWSKCKYAPLTSCDVERSFSAYKLIFTHKRRQLTPSNLEKMLVIYCNSNYNMSQ